MNKPLVTHEGALAIADALLTKIKHVGDWVNKAGDSYPVNLTREQLSKIIMAARLRPPVKISGTVPP